MNFSAKKTKMPAAVVFSCFFLCFFSSVAVLGYLTAENGALNVFSAGETECYIQEDFPEPSISPDGFVKKEVTVVNSGNLPAYARVRLVFSDSEVEAVASLKGVDGNLWSYKESEDFYYYNGKLAAGETVKFMDGVCFDTEAGGKTEDFQITVYAELWDRQEVNGT